MNVLKTKVLIVTDSHVLSTGMAETTRLIFSTLLDKYQNVYELHQVGLCHIHAVSPLRWPVYPTKTEKSKGRVRLARNDLYGEKTFWRILGKIEPDIVFAFNDPQNVMYLCTAAEERRYKIVLYLNFDGIPLPVCDGPLPLADRFLTMSEFSRRALLASNPSIADKNVGFMYSPADSARFKPVGAIEKIALRRELLPDWMPDDAFVLGWVGRNQWRKQIWLLYKIIHYLRKGSYLVCPDCTRVSLFDWDPSQQCHLAQAGQVLESRPHYHYDKCSHCGCTRVKPADPLDNVFLWLHMPQGLLDAWPVRLLENMYDVQPGRDVHYTDGCSRNAALAPADMPLLYQLWDCLLYLSGGEGFGIPAWEAMCSALPVVYTNYSSHSEFLGKANAGLPVGGILQPEPKSCLLRMIADVPQVIEAVRRFYVDRELRQLLGFNGRSFTQCYTTEIQAEKWHFLFQELRRDSG